MAFNHVATAFTFRRMYSLTDSAGCGKANADVKVLSGKQVAGFIAKSPASLFEKVIQQISFQLEQRCRDVEF